MSLLVLLFTVFIAFVCSELMDTFPGLLWGWAHWPRWFLGAVVVLILAWSLGEPTD